MILQASFAVCTPGHHMKMLDKVQQKLSEALDRKVSLESQVEKLNLEVKESKDECEWLKKLSSELEMARQYKHERRIMQIETDDALSEVQGLRKQIARMHSSSVVSAFNEFSYLELQIATNDFDSSLQIGQGGYGNMYKGFLHHTEVRIKLFAPKCVKNDEEFDRQVSYISKLRHPNLVALIGACRDPWALVYEYLPCGNLEDWLINCKDNTAMPWKMRIRKAVDICSALIFVHSTGSVHGDLTLKKLILDANFTCKIIGFGVYSKDTSSDVYSFGTILLSLLTGKQAGFELLKKVEYALEKGNLHRMLDPSAGDWPYVQAKQLAHMAVRCCNSNTNSRFDLASDAWRVLQPMRTSSSSLPSILIKSHDQPPHHFLCPILQEIMEDPHVAADGFTYEAEAIRGWFEGGHTTSPMTNLKLATLELTPNRTLRSVIQEWKESKSITK